MLKRFFIAIFILSLAFAQTAIITAHETEQHPTISIFSPGFFNKHCVSIQQAARYKKNNILQGTYTACSYDDTRAHANFGQERDIANLFEQYQGCCNADPNTRIILAGISRGASTLFNFIGNKKPKNIAAIIAESPFASVDDIIDHKINLWHMGWMPGIKNFTFALMRMYYPSYNVHGPQPINSITFHKLDTPILITCSKKDTVIPYTSSVRLAHELKKQGYQNVYLLIFTEGEHGFLSYQEEFQNVVNALYAHYNLPHNPESAQKGAARLELCKL